MDATTVTATIIENWSTLYDQSDLGIKQCWEEEKKMNKWSVYRQWTQSYSITTTER